LFLLRACRIALAAWAILILGLPFGGIGHAQSSLQPSDGPGGWRPADANVHVAIMRAKRIGLENVPPTVRITCPEPSADSAFGVLPSVRILWEGLDPDGEFTTRPIKYKYILLAPWSQFPAALAVADPDSLRRYYVGHPLGPWAGWDSTSADTTQVRFNNLIPSQNYVFALIGFDEAGDYSPVFDLSSNILHFRVTFEGYLGPRLTLIGPGFEYRYPSGGYCPCPSSEMPTEVPANLPVTFGWSAEPDGPCQSADIRSYRWVLDIADLGDETPRSDETDVQHWSPKSLNITSATIGPFSSGEEHRLFVEVEDIAGLRSLGIIRLTVVPTVGVAGTEPGAFRVLPPRPNPARGVVRMELVLPSPQRVSVQVFDTGGRRVRTCVEGEPLGAGIHTLRWDGLDEHGAGVHAGVYFARVIAGPYSHVTRVVKLD